MHRTLLTSAALIGLTAAGCKPAADTYDAGCYPAPTSTPVDSGVAPSCTPWTSTCDTAGTTALQTQITSAFTAAGACQQDSDCALYGGELKMNCYQTTYTPPIAMTQRGALDAKIQSILCGFCSACYDGGGLLQGDVTPYVDGGNCTEVFCNGGQCSSQTFQEP